MSESKSIKPIEERLSESVSLLKQLKDMGIKPNHDGYIQVKAHIDAWIKENQSFLGKIDFTLHQRRGELFLPMRPKTFAHLHMKHHVFEQ
jgi:hypothetical protein